MEEKIIYNDAGDSFENCVPVRRSFSVHNLRSNNKKSMIERIKDYM